MDKTEKTGAIFMLCVALFLGFMVYSYFVTPTYETTAHITIPNDGSTTYELAQGPMLFFGEKQAIPENRVIEVVETQQPPFWWMEPENEEHLVQIKTYTQQEGSIVFEKLTEYEYEVVFEFTDMEAD